MCSDLFCLFASFIESMTIFWNIKNRQGHVDIHLWNGMKSEALSLHPFKDILNDLKAPDLKNVILVSKVYLKFLLNWIESLIIDHWI